MNAGSLISGSFAFSKPSLYIWKFSIHVLLKPTLKDFEHKLTSMESEHSCPVAQTFFSTDLLWNWDEDLPFPVWWPLTGFSKFSDILSAVVQQPYLLGFEIVQEFHHPH